MAIKRARIDNDTDEEKSTIVPKNYQFNFTPTLKPNQRIFDTDDHYNPSQPPVELSINTLTQRFRSRIEKSLSRNVKKQDQVALVTPQQHHPQAQQQPVLHEPRFIKHQHIAYIVIVYIQMAFIAIISTFVIYFFFKIILAVKQDFNLKAREHLDTLHREKLACTNNYLINKCGQSDRIPAVDRLCDEWAACMNRELVVSQVKASAEAIAEIINSFVEPISYKTLLFFSVFTIGTLVFSSISINMFKRNYNHKPSTTPN